MDYDKHCVKWIEQGTVEPSSFTANAVGFIPTYPFNYGSIIKFV